MRLDEVVEVGIERGGAQQVLASRSTAINCRVANNTITTNGVEESLAAGVVALDQGRLGVQVADVFGPDQVLALAEEARARAATSQVAPDAMPPVTPEETAPSMGEKAPDELRPAALEGLLDGLGQVLEGARADGLRCYGYAHATTSSELLGSATGIRIQGSRRAASLSMTLKSDDLQRSVWSGALAMDFSQVEPLAMYQRLKQRLGWAERRVQLPAGPYEVILEPSATADLIQFLYWEMHARGADEQRTVFGAKEGARLGEQLYAPGIRLSSDPGHPRMRVPGFVRSLASSEYSSVFDNGLPAAPAVWVEGGVQRELICPRRWGQDHGHPFRPDVDNLSLAGGKVSLEEMVARTERALLISSLWYIREVDSSTLLLTGLTRDGVFLVENGEVVGAVNNFRFNESPVSVLARTTEIGHSQLALPRETGDDMFVEAPPIRVERFFMSSVSDAI